MTHMSEAGWFWAVFGLVGVGLVFVAWLGQRRRRARPVELQVGDAGVCAACGYPMQGLPGRTCPECGNDLDATGILTPRYRRWQSAPPLLRGLIWSTAVVLVAALLFAFAFMNYLPMRLTVGSSAIFGTPPAAVVREELTTNDAGFVQGVGWQDRARTLRAQRHEWIVVAGTRGAPFGLRLTWDVLADRWSLSGEGIEDDSGPGKPPPKAIDRFVAALPAGPATRPASAEAIDGVVLREQWYAKSQALPVPPERVRLLLWHLFRDPPTNFASRQGDIDVTDEQDREAAWEARLRTEIDALPQGWFEGDEYDYLALSTAPNSGGGWITRSRPAVLPLIAAGGFWPLVWLAGLPFVLRRRLVRVVASSA